MKKILLVEDEKILTEMYKEKLAQSGFEVILAFSAEEGIKLVKKEKIDLVVLDILLPKENGLFFLREQKNNSKVSSIPVVIFSNYDDVDSKKEAKEFGAEAYLIKTNITPAELVEKIKECL